MHIYVHTQPNIQLYMYKCLMFILYCLVTCCSWHIFSNGWCEINEELKKVI